MAASQDFRDGAATALSQLAKRVHKIEGWGVNVDAALVAKLAAGLADDYGGSVYSSGEE